MEATLKCYVDAMSVEVALRDLRNHTADLLRRVESGEELLITKRGKPVARLAPIKASGRRWMPKDELIHILDNSRADPGLLDDLKSMPGGTTDDLDDPYE